MAAPLALAARTALAAVAAVAALLLAGCGDRATPSANAITAHCRAIADTPVAIAGGHFAMGADDVYAEEGPVRDTRVDRFWIDPHEVTNRQFATFVAATDYVTKAEQAVDPRQFAIPVNRIPPDMLRPGSAVFVAPDRPTTDYNDWWRYVPGANWRQPFGPGGTVADPARPVVHLHYADMAAYARWRRGRLPREAEWEFAARAGAPTSRAQPAQANSWQGAFPLVDEGRDGFKAVAPVGCYDANAFGLYDMVGNVWEMTADIYAPGLDPATRDNPVGPPEGSALDPANPGLPSRVIKGGSWLCAPNYCQRYRAAARAARDPELGASNVGFRLVYDRAPNRAPDRLAPPP